MEVHTVLTRDALKELRKYLITPKARNFSEGAYIMAFLIGLLAVAGGKYYGAAILLILSAVLFIETYIFSLVILNKIMKSINELYNTCMIEGKAVFGEDKLKCISFASKGETNISYSVMADFAETKNYYAMFTKEQSMLIMDKQQFTPDTEAQFLQIVKEKMPGILKGKKLKAM